MVSVWWLGLGPRGPVAGAELTGQLLILSGDVVMWWKQCFEELLNLVNKSSSGPAALAAERWTISLPCHAC